MKKCRHDVHKLKPNCNTKLSNLSKEEWTALINLKNQNDLVIKAADKGGATVVWRTDLYQQEAIRQLSDPTFYTKVNKDLTPANQKIVKDTIQELITNKNYLSLLRISSSLLLGPCACISNLKFTNPTTQAVQLFQHAVALLNLSRAI